MNHVPYLRFLDQIYEKSADTNAHVVNIMVLNETFFHKINGDEVDALVLDSVRTFFGPKLNEYVHEDGD